MPPGDQKQPIRWRPVAIATAIVAASLLLTLWLGVALVRAENERYALLLGLCRDASGEADVECLATVQTRPAWWWHVAYALGG